MSEHVEAPCAEYNAGTGKICTLVGNWYEERVLEAKTGVRRSKAPLAAAQLDVSPDGSGGGGGGSATIPAATARQASAAPLPTRPRVIDHSDQTLPSAWVSGGHASYRPPTEQTGREPCVYLPTGVAGPREQQELALLRAQAAAAPAPPPPERHFETTARAELPAHSLAGLVLGARVMHDHDGRPAQRDATWLVEAGVMGPAAAHRLAAGPGGTAAAAALARPPCDPDAPVSIWAKAAAAKGAVYMGTGRPGKRHTFARDDAFTKPMGHPNKDASDE